MSCKLKLAPLFLLLFLSVTTVFATESPDAVPPDQITAPNDISVKITDFPQDTVLSGDELTITAVISSRDPAVINADWMLFGQPVSGGTYENLEINGALTVTLTAAAPEYEYSTAIAPYSIIINNGDIPAPDSDWTNNYDQITVAVQNRTYMMLDELFESAILNARITAPTPVYASNSIESAIITNLSADTNCGVYYDNFVSTAFCRININGIKGFVPASCVKLLNDMRVIFDDASNTQKELYVKKMGWDSETDYLLWLDIARQRLNVFLRVDGAWLILDSFLCSSGANDTPTPIGEYEIYAKMNRWTFGNYWCGPIMYFKPNGYALHSYLIRYDGTPYDGRLGQPLSHGCIRIHPDKINWLHKTVPFNTRVIIK